MTKSVSFLARRPESSTSPDDGRRPSLRPWLTALQMAGDGARVFELDGPQPRNCTGRTGERLVAIEVSRQSAARLRRTGFLRPRKPAELSIPTGMQQHSGRRE